MTFQFCFKNPTKEAKPGRAEGVAWEAARSKTLGMTTRGGIHLVSGSSRCNVTYYRWHELWVMHPQFLASYVYRILLASFTNSLGSYLHSIGKNFTEAFSLGYLLKHGYHGPVIAPG